MRKFWDGKYVTLLNVRLPYHQASALIIALLVALGLRVLLYRTRVGVAMRASVDDRPLAMLNGARPAVSAMMAWAIGTSLAALAGILIAPTLTLSALPLTLLIINAYAAAMIGRLRSLPMTFVGALILGLANDFGRGYLTKIHVGQQYIQGFLDTIPIIILFIVLLIMPQVSLRGHRALRTTGDQQEADLAGIALLCRRGHRRRGHARRRAEQGQPGQRQQDVGLRHHRPVDDPAGRIRRPDLALPAQLRRYRHGRRRPRRTDRQPHRPGLGRC